MLTIECKQEYTFQDLMNECGGQAFDNIMIIYDNDKEDEFMQYLNDSYCGTMPTLTDIIDELAYDWENLFDYLDIQEDEEEGE